MCSIVVHYVAFSIFYVCCFFFFQAEDGIRDAQESRGLGDVYKRQEEDCGTLRGLVATSIMNKDRVVESLYDRILGRTLSLIHI